MTQEELEELAAKLSARQIALEAQLIEQDHRWVSVWLNLYHSFLSHARGDPRRAAALKAVLWRFFSPATAVGIGVSVVSVIGLLLALQANYLLAVQNRKLDQQTFLNEAQRRAGLTAEFASIMQQVGREKAEIQARKKTAHKAGKDQPDEPKLLRLSQDTVLRIVVLSRFARPYYYLELTGDKEVYLGDAPRTARNQQETQRTRSKGLLGWLNQLLDIDAGPAKDNTSPQLIAKPLSPERGQLLVSLSYSQVDMLQLAEAVDFSGADLRKVILVQNRFGQTNLSGADFSQAFLLDVDLTSANLHNANFREACLDAVDFTGAQLRGAVFSGAHLFSVIVPRPDVLAGADLTDANLHGMYVIGEGWLNQLVTQPDAPRGIERDGWELEAAKPPRGKERQNDKWFIVTRKQGMGKLPRPDSCSQINYGV